MDSRQLSLWRSAWAFVRVLIVFVTGFATAIVIEIAFWSGSSTATPSASVLPPAPLLAPGVYVGSIEGIATTIANDILENGGKKGGATRSLEGSRIQFDCVAQQDSHRISKETVLSHWYKFPTEDGRGIAITANVVMSFLSQERIIDGQSLTASGYVAEIHMFGKETVMIFVTACVKH